MNCNNCSIIINNYNSIKLSEYNNIYKKSKIIYCYDCWNNKNSKLICNYCSNFYSEFKCNKNCFKLVLKNENIIDDYNNICLYCLCDGLDCDYCNRFDIDFINNILIKKKNLISYKFKNYFSLIL